MSHSYDPIDTEAGGSSRSSESVGFLSRLDRRSRLALGGLAVLALVALIGLASSPAAAPVAAVSPLPLAQLSRAADVEVTSAESSLVSAAPVVLLEKSSAAAKGENRGESADHETKPNVCEDPNYTKVTLKTAKESTMVALFDNLHGEKKFEASDVIPVGNDFLVVFDNLYRIGRIDQKLAFRSNQHQLVASHPARTGDSGFEAIVYVPEQQRLYVFVEAEERLADPYHDAAMEASAKHGEKPLSKKEQEEADEKAAKEAAKPEQPETEYHAIIEEINMPSLFESRAAESKTEPTYTMGDRCPCEYAFTSGNKGFEGAVHVDFKGTVVMMGLCEGNHCEGGRRGREVGNGRVVLMTKHHKTNESGEEGCVWKTINLLALPATAAFADYSAIAIIAASDPVTNKILPNQYTLAVTSQETSQVWLGRLRTGHKSDFSDWKLTDGVVYNFPRSGSGCEIEYCNIEGISFLDDNMLVAVSDKMKGAGRQPYRCLAKDQSIHTFVLP